MRRVSSLVSERFAGAVAAPKTVEEELTQLTDAFQRIGEVVGIMAAITAVLAIVGVYGVVALAAKRRLKEMGIRLALGARRVDIYRAMVRPNARPVVIGLLVGALFTTVDGRSRRIGCSRRSFRCESTDPIAFVVAGLALAGGDERRRWWCRRGGRRQSIRHLSFVKSERRVIRRTLALIVPDQRPTADGARRIAPIASKPQV